MENMSNLIVNEEEKDAIRYLNYCIYNNMPLPEEALSWVKIVLNLIDKLQKENEELEKEVLHWKGQYHLLSREINCISKDKIREKIKELEEDLIENYGELGESLTTTEIKTLKKLLEEE